MFRKILIVSILTTSLSSGCQNYSKTSQTNTPGNAEGNITLRDLSINKSNAYNDLFLDSADLENFIAKEMLQDTVSAAIRNFYKVRNFEYAWFSSTGLIEQSFSFCSLYSSENEGDQSNISLETQLDKMRAENDTTIKANTPSVIKTELQITVRFIKYASDKYKGKGISAATLGTYIPAKRKSIAEFAKSLLEDSNVNTDYNTLNEPYRLLKTQLGKYLDIENKGGWETISGGHATYQTGFRSPAISLIKKRLQVTGELANKDTSEVFNNELEEAVKAYQLNNGFKQSGTISPALIQDMNITVAARVQQLVINMQRMRWTPTGLNGIIIIVNIPEFEVYVDSNKNILFKMDVVVGAEGHSTTMFSGKVNQIVFSPYWNIPASIVKKEVVPGLKRDINYLKKRDMEITGKEGGLPVVRQKPGAKNALGKVKFLFPNSFDIYMHDSPEKGLFKKEERDLSHGCIRLSDAPKMAYFLLRNSSAWPPEKILAAMNSGKEEFVRLKDPVPVIITYYTAWVDKSGLLHFADDIYKHDKEMALKMFTNPQ